MADKPPKLWNRMPKMSFSSKDLARRMKKVEGATVKHARRFVFRRIENFKEVRRHIAFWVATVGILIAASGLQLYWYQQSYRELAPARGGTYAEAVQGPISTLNPLFARSSAEESLSRLMFSRLLTYDASGSLRYDLAENMTLSDNERVYTVTIRPDAQWHDGVYVRASDVVFTINTVKNSAVRAEIAGWNDIRVEAVDDRTVTFTVPSIYAPFPHALATLPIVPEHILRDVEPATLREAPFSSRPIGSGAFTFRFSQDIDRAEDRRVVYLARNDNYYLGVPHLDRLQVHSYESTDAIIRAVNTGEVNGATDIPVTRLTEVNSNRLSVSSQPVNNGVYAIMNTGNGVLRDKKVRQALQAATDTAKVRASVSDRILPLHLPFMADLVVGKLPAAPKQDTAKAAKLLDDAGWKRQGGERVNKAGEPLQISLVTTKNPDFEAVLTELQRQWREVGVTVTTSVVDPADPSQNFVQNTLQRRQYDVLLYQLTIGGDPDVYAYWHSSQAGTGLNFSDYASTVVDDNLASARAVIDPSLRGAKYVTVAKQWLADAPAIGLYQSTMQYVTAPSVATYPADEVLIASGDRYNDLLDWSVGWRIVNKTP